MIGQVDKDGVPALRIELMRPSAIAAITRRHERVEHDDGRGFPSLCARKEQSATTVILGMLAGDGGVPSVCVAILRKTRPVENGTGFRHRVIVGAGSSDVPCEITLRFLSRVAPHVMSTLKDVHHRAHHRVAEQSGETLHGMRPMRRSGGWGRSSSVS